MVLRILGISLVLIGLTGTLGGLYALKMVHTYDFGELSPAKVTTSIAEISKELEIKKEEIEDSIDEVSAHLNNASSSVSEAGRKVSQASRDVSTASRNLSTAAENLRSASSYNKDAGVYLSTAATGLRNWAEDYEFNDSSLPYKYDFISSVDKIATAAEKLEDTGEKLEDTSTSLEGTASSLDKTSSSLEESSAELRDAGGSLNQTRKKFQELKEPLGSFLLTASNALKESTKDIEALSGLASSLKTIAYALVGYLIVFHLVVLGVGIAIIIIEVNLFYAGGE
jgi:ABC-type transporter Mla subunit MlaD